MSHLLVGLQFILIALVAFPSGEPIPSVLNCSLFAAGIAVFLLALFAMKRRTFSVMPEPKEQGELVARGVYRLVRHPMYVAVLLCACGVSLAYQETWKWICTVLLMLVLMMKIRREEKLLLVRYPDYAAYRAKVKALIPFVL